MFFTGFQEQLICQPDSLAPSGLKSWPENIHTGNMQKFS